MISLSFLSFSKISLKSCYKLQRNVSEYSFSIYDLKCPQNIFCYTKYISPVFILKQTVKYYSVFKSTVCKPYILRHEIYCTIPCFKRRFLLSYAKLKSLTFSKKHRTYTGCIYQKSMLCDASKYT